MIAAIVIGGGGLIGAILTIAILGLIVWLVVTYIPMPPVFKTVILIIAAIFVILVLLNVLGISFGDGPIVRYYPGE